MIAAVLELWNLERNLFRRFLRFLLYCRKFCAQLFVRGYFLLDLSCRFRIVMEPVVKATLCFRNNPLANVGIAKLIFCLAFEHRVLHFYKDRRSQTFAYRSEEHTSEL